MIIQRGTILDPQFTDTIKCVTTNGIVKANGEAVMGAGLALVVARLYPQIPKTLGEYITKWGNRAFVLGENWVSFPTKGHWRNPSDLDLILASADQITQMADKFSWDKVLLPKVGCGLGGLKWDDVKKELRNILDDRFVALE